MSQNMVLLGAVDYSAASKKSAMYDVAGSNRNSLMDTFTASVQKADDFALTSNLP